MKQILVIGSSNTDMVIKTRSLPKPGETVVDGNFLLNPGGRGANQAVAAARLGGTVTFVYKRGNDLFGNQSLGFMMRESVDIQYVVKDERNPSGVALITVDKCGATSTVIAPGANGSLVPEDISEKIFSHVEFGILLLQLEIPMKTVEYAARRSAERGIKVILNPAPFKKIPEALFRHLWLITPNKTEAERLTGIRVTDHQSADVASRKLVQRGVPNVVITMGDCGAYLNSSDYCGIIPAEKIQTVDVTAVGDVFNGALAVSVSEGKDLRESVEFANIAAAISATRMGALSSAPYRKEIILRA